MFLWRSLEPWKLAALLERLAKSSAAGRQGAAGQRAEPVRSQGDAAPAASPPKSSGR
jgi:hypothetical protein